VRAYRTGKDGVAQEKIILHATFDKINEQIAANKNRVSQTSF
jgi:hypothetical protein